VWKGVLPVHVVANTNTRLFAKFEASV